MLRDASCPGIFFYNSLDAAWSEAAVVTLGIRLTVVSTIIEK